MNNYIVLIDSRGAHLEHRSHKYVSRTWKNGHWNYTYPKYGQGSTYAVHTKSAAENLSSLASKYRKEVNADKNVNFYNTLKFNGTGKDYAQSRINTNEKFAQDYARQARKERDLANKEEAAYVAKMNKEIKKWNKSPVTKILTVVNKGKDLINKLLSKKKVKPRSYTVNK